MTINDYMPILRRTGLVLMAVGFIDIGVMIYCITNEISYSTSFNIFAVIAGFLLFRGGLRTATYVRWYSTFMLSAAISLVAAFPFMQPLSLTLTQIRLNLGMTFIAMVIMLLMLWFLYWLSKELGRQPILDATIASGLKIRSMRIASGFGVGLVIALVVIASLISGGETAKRAIAIAMQQAGPDYSYYVGSMQTSYSSHGSSTSAVVTVWDDKEIKRIPVHWDDH